MSSSSDDNQDTRVVAVVLIAVILLAVGLAVGMGIHKSRGGVSAGAAVAGAGDASAEAGAGAAAVASEGESDHGAASSHGDAGQAMASAADQNGEAAQNGTSAESASQAEGDSSMTDIEKTNAAGDASVIVEDGVVQFYFASGKADLAAGASAVLADAVAAAKAGKKLVISGFHDPTGNKAFNEQLAKKRAMAVRDALMADGVAESSIELRKPEETTGTGNNAAARRVEVMIAE